MKFVGIFLLMLSAGFSALGQHYPEGYTLANEYDDYVYDGVADGEDQEAGDQDAAGPAGVLPQFTATPGVLNPREGEPVSIDCTSSSSSNAHVLVIRMFPKNEPGREVLMFAGKVRINAPQRATLKDQILTITDVERADSGTYVCGYQAGTNDISISHTLDVYFPPNIRRKQKTIDVIKGENVELECRVGGNPVPTITWSKMDGAMPSESQTEDGSSIIFEKVDRHVSGIYQCTAENGVGEPVSAKREIIVSYKPEIMIEKEVIRTGKGDQVELVCLVHAFPDAMVEWFHGSPMVPVNADSYASAVTDGHRHILTLEDVSDFDFGDYICNATNSIGSASNTIHVTDAPSIPSITSDPHSAEDDSYTLTWTTESFYPIVQYSLMYRKAKANESTEEPGEWAQIEESVEDEQTGLERSFQHTLTDLDRATNYNAKLSVRNNYKGTEEISFNFSTKKVTPTTTTTLTSFSSSSPSSEVESEDLDGGEKQETADHQSTSGASKSTEMASATVMLALCLYKLQ